MTLQGRDDCLYSTQRPLHTNRRQQGMACTRSAHSHKKQRGALEQHFLSVESRDHLTFLGRKKINPSLVLLQHYHSATTKLKISLSRWTIRFPPILFSSFCGQLNPQKLWIFFFFFFLSHCPQITDSFTNHCLFRKHKLQNTGRV